MEQCHAGIDMLSFARRNYVTDKKLGYTSCYLHYILKYLNVTRIFTVTYTHSRTSTLLETLITTLY